MNNQILEIIQAVKDLGPGATMTAIARHLGVNKSTVSRRAQVALKAGLLVNTQTIKGLPACLEVGVASQGVASPDTVGVASEGVAQGGVALPGVTPLRTCFDCPQFRPNNGPNPTQGWGKCLSNERGRYGCAIPCKATKVTF